MTSQQARARLIAGLAAVLLLTACGEDAPPIDQPATTLADLAPRNESDVRTALAALDPCDLLAASDVEGRPSSLHACADLGTDAVEVRLGVPLDAEATDALATIDETYVVKVSDEQCRILVPASLLTGIQIHAEDCDRAERVASAVIQRLASGDTKAIQGPRSHDACSLLESAVAKATPKLEARDLTSCRAAVGIAASTAVNDGTTVTLQEIGQTPRRQQQLNAGSSLEKIAGRPAVVGPLPDEGCRIQVRLESPPAQVGPFAIPVLWATLYSTTHDCRQLREATARLVAAADQAVKASSTSPLLYVTE